LNQASKSNFIERSTLLSSNKWDYSWTISKL